MAANIHISISAEPIYYIGSFPITNSMLTSALVTLGIIIFAILANRALKKTNKPTGLQNVAEFIVESFFHFCSGITGDMKRAQIFMPWVATFFIFILLNNWSGLIPGVGFIFVPKPHEPSEEHAVSLVKPVTAADGLTVSEEPLLTGEVAETIHEEVVAHQTTPLFRAGTADLNMTLALGIISVIMIQFFGFKFLGLPYIGKYFNFSSPIAFFVGILEFVTEIGKIISFGFRLFGNIFAGEVLIAVLLYLTKLIVPIPFYGLEIFVGMIQALVFSMLSLVLYNMATIGHGEEH